MSTVVVMPAALRDEANAVARQMQLSADGTEGGENTFSVPLFSIQDATDETPSHYWCTVKFTPENRAAVGAILPQFPGGSVHDYDSDSNPGFPQGVLARLNLRASIIL